MTVEESGLSRLAVLGGPVDGPVGEGGQNGTENMLITRGTNTIRTDKIMENDIITGKAITAAMQAIEDDLWKNSYGYAKMVNIRNSLIANLKQSLNQNLD